MWQRYLLVLWFGFSIAVPFHGAALAQPRQDAAGVSNKILQPVVDWFERAHREYQGVVVKELSVPTRNSVALPGEQTNRRPSLIEQARAWLGLGSTDSALAPATPAGPVHSAENTQAAELLERQKAARALETQRAAEAVRLAAEVERTQNVLEAADPKTVERQKVAEAARIAEAERRKPVMAEPEKPEPEKKRPVEVAQAPRETSPAVTPPPVEEVPSPPVPVPEQKTPQAAPAPPKAVVQAPAATEERWNRLPRSTAREAAKKPVRAEAPQVRDVAQVEAPAAADNATHWNRLPRTGAALARTVTSAAEKLAASASKAGDRLLEGTRSGLGFTAKAHQPKKSRLECRRAGVAVAPPATYVVKRGDSLWTIARRHYEQGRRYARIVRANEAKIASPDLIFPCQKFYLPRRHAMAADEPDDGPS